MLVSASHRATTLMRPLAIASLRMFLPHQPEPMSAVRYLCPAFAASNGAALNARPAAAVVLRKFLRVEYIAQLFFRFTTTTSPRPLRQYTWPFASTGAVQHLPPSTCARAVGLNPDATAGAIINSPVPLSAMSFPSAMITPPEPNAGCDHFSVPVSNSRHFSAAFSVVSPSTP